LKNARFQDYSASNFDEVEENYRESDKEKDTMEDEYENSQLQDENEAAPISDDDLEKVLSRLTKDELTALASSLNDDEKVDLKKRELPGWAGKNTEVSSYRKNKQHDTYEEDYEEVDRKVHSAKHCPAHCKNLNCAGN
jgi:hypothetical protein